MYNNTIKTVSTNTMNVDKWVGTDESGKGDYFGPLVVSAVYVDPESFEKLTALGIRDSKKISDNVIKKLAVGIKQNCVFEIVVIGNKKYNELYSRFNNLNKMLAWAHARAIENILAKTDCENVLSDKFADVKVIESSLMQKGRKVNLVQRTKAESDIAVAAASIVARAEFVNRMDKMSAEYNMTFSKGASKQVLEQAKVFVAKHGKDSLENIAKLHFKSTKEVLNN